MRTQRLLAKDFFASVAPMVKDGGVCQDTAQGQSEILEFLDLSCFELSKRLDSEGTLFEWYSDVQQGCFALPQECREARQIGINGVPLRQRSEFYIGKVATGSFEGGCGPWECRDLGDFYIPNYLPKVLGIRIALVALDNADAGKQVVVEVTNQYGVPVKETLTLLGDGAPAVMAEVAFDVTYFKKPKTYGPVSLQIQYDDGQRFIVCQYHPDTEEGLFRRKQLPQRFQGCNVVRILGKARYVNITDPEQIVPYNDRIAIGWACSATAAWRRRDHEIFGLHMNLALDCLRQQMKDSDSASNVRQINVVSGLSQPSLRWQGAGGFGGYGARFGGFGR